jgi:hypothetical protein
MSFLGLGNFLTGGKEEKELMQRGFEREEAASCTDPRKSIRPTLFSSFAPFLLFSC